MTHTLMAARVTAMMKASPDARLIRVGSTSCVGTIRTSDETADDGTGALVRHRLIVVTLPTDAVSVAEGDTMTVYASRDATSASTAYVVRDVLRVEDGLLTKYRLVRAVST